MIVRRRLRHLQRFRKIAAALVRNGFGFVVHELGFSETVTFFRGGSQEDIHKKTVNERVRLILEELGPTFVKLGQIASTRPDLIPADLIAELEQLQDKVPPFSYEEAVRIIEEELGDSIGELFAEFEPHPVASASIGQVHKAKLPDGTVVAVKVQRPRITAMIEADLDILAELSRIAENRLEWAKLYRLGEIVEELTKSLRAELDYMAEARNGEKFADQCKRMEHVSVPEIYREYGSRKVLTMEFMTGIRLSEPALLDQAGIDRTLIASRLASAIFHQILVEGFFHGDPHPGNVLVLPDGRLGLLDFGMVGRLSPEMKKHFASLVIALRNQSSKGILRAITKMGIVPDDVNAVSLRADVDELRDKYYKIPFSQVRMGEAVNDLFGVAFRHRIRIPAEMTLLGKTLLTMEGVVTSLDPSFSVFDVAEPYGRRMFREQFDLGKLAKKWIEDTPDYMDLITEVPLSLKSLSTFVQRGKLRVEITAPELTALLNKMDRITNKMSFSIVLLSLSIIMVGLIIGSSMGHQESMLWRFPVIEIGLGIAAVLVLWLVYAIFKSGRF
ncbi:ubiquinone biosynthesis protein [Paenibacillus sp. UNCCL117]|uniref:ABC1 kinase family protein n=1 Tax=unclassified Paenibacillus TaxID=185978 RepID=UPI00088CEDE6|nr:MULTISPECIES: AarF/ABC1/UbiB kinase family protein [unclassified Paenibacillus]SDC43698.1 2-octaprenylphenol hydroxylase [Paenibacillus sp. cl123]SFW12898.1 ubiquinone biosynthesis protein [Paenibacillus sp. UNCCL117]